MLTLVEAAQQASMSKSALHRAIQRGHISISRTETGSIRIDPSELARFVSSRSSRPSHPQREPVGGDGTDHPAPRDMVRDAMVAALEREIGVLRQVIDDLKMQRDDLKSERDKWSAQAERLALAPPQPHAPASTLRRGWWPFRRGA